MNVIKGAPDIQKNVTELATDIEQKILQKQKRSRKLKIQRSFDHATNMYDLMERLHWVQFVCLDHIEHIFYDNFTP